MKKRGLNLLNQIYYFLHKKSMLDYSYSLLLEDWPSITKKLGLNGDDFELPSIGISQNCPEYDMGVIRLFLPTLIMAYKGKKIKEYGLELDCWDILERDIIHECVHHLQENLYDTDNKNYHCAKEGLAEIVSVEILLEKERYNIIATSIAEHFMDAKEEYKDYFGLPKEYNKHIERIIKDDNCIPPKGGLYYAKGFLHICKNYIRRKNYLGLLQRPFGNSEVLKR